MAQGKTVDARKMRAYRNSRLYRSLTRVLRVYNRRLVASLHERGFEDFTLAFPQVLSNLDLEGTRITVLAARAGMTKQAAGQLVTTIERCGYVIREPAADDGRATVVRFTERGRELLRNVLDLVREIETDFANLIGEARFEEMREGLYAIALQVDPEGAFGSEDEPARPGAERAP